MNLIIGGYRQGKLRYAMKKYGVEVECIAEDFKMAENARIFHNFQQAVQKTLDSGEDPVKKLEYLLTRNPDVIIICDEVGCGVVPVDREERIWRETVGRLCCTLAQRAESVERVFCGLAQRLK